MKLSFYRSAGVWRMEKEDVNRASSALVMKGAATDVPLGLQR